MRYVHIYLPFLPCTIYMTFLMWQNHFLSLQYFLIINLGFWSLSVFKILHSIFFLGFIHKTSLTFEDILSAKMVEIVRQEFPEPFMKYRSHLPKRTPFSILLEIVSHIRLCIYIFLFSLWISSIFICQMFPQKETFNPAIMRKYIANIFLTC